MLQESLLVDAHLVELVDIHQQKASQVHFRVTFAPEVQTVRISETQFGRKDDAAEGGFSVALCAYQ